MKPHWTDTFRSPSALLCFFGTFVIGLASDLSTKSLAVQHLKDGAPITLIPWLIRLEYTENHGAVFGIGQGQRPLFLTVSAIAIGFLLYLFATSERNRLYQIILGMLLAGVLGNMYDRLQFGYVRDMIHGLPGVTWPQWVVNFLPSSMLPPNGSRRVEVFPWIFNIADSLLCVGVAMMIIYSLMSEHHRKHMLKVAENAGRTNDSKDS
jgi:lipoprotein signal peptidase